MERRNLPDRRRHRTPIFSRYSWVGRRKSFRRQKERERGGYVDRCSPCLLSLLALLLGLNLLDGLFTAVILDRGGSEVNPIVGWALQAYGPRFWAWKFAVVSGNLFLLCLHSRFRYVQKVLLGIALLYLTVVSYQVALIAYSWPDPSDSPIIFVKIQ